MTEQTKGLKVQSTVKDESLIAIRREQMIQGAIIDPTLPAAYISEKPPSRYLVTSSPQTAFR